MSVTPEKDSSSVSDARRQRRRHPCFARELRQALMLIAASILLIVGRGDGVRVAVAAGLSPARGIYLRLVAIAFFARLQLYAGLAMLLAALPPGQARRLAIVGATSGLVLPPFIDDFILLIASGRRSDVHAHGDQLVTSRTTTNARSSRRSTGLIHVIVVEEVTDWVWWNIIQGHLRERYPHILQGGVDAAMALSRLPLHVVHHHAA